MENEQRGIAAVRSNGLRPLFVITPAPVLKPTLAQFTGFHPAPLGFLINPIARVSPFRDEQNPSAQRENSLFDRTPSRTGLAINKSENRIIPV